MIKFKAITPKIPRFEFLARQLELALNEEGKQMASELGQFFMTWEGKPDVVTYVERAGGSFVVNVELRANDELLDIVRFVIYGTKRHTIKSRGDYPMVFPHGETFTPKTQPGVIQSGPGFPGGPEIVRVYEVDHPGNAPRNTLRVIAEKHRKFFRARMAKAVTVGLAKSIAKGVVGR